jgi:Flp pilus assembly protein CpaB
LILVGIAVFVLGGALVFVALRNNDNGSSPKASATKVSVLVATQDLKPGALGDDVLTANGVTVQQVPVSDRKAGAVTSTAALSGQILTSAVHKGDQLTSANLRAQSARAQSITIPSGKQAVAVTLPFTPAAAAYAAPGDEVNVYAVVRPGDPGAPPNAPYTQLIVSNVSVLDVSQQVAPQASDVAAAADSTGTSAEKNRTGAGSLTYLLALTPSEASKVIFTSSMNELYFTVVRHGDPASTAGATNYGNVNP